MRFFSQKVHTFLFFYTLIRKYIPVFKSEGIFLKLSPQNRVKPKTFSIFLSSSENYNWNLFFIMTNIETKKKLNGNLLHHVTFLFQISSYNLILKLEIKMTFEA